MSTIDPADLEALYAEKATQRAQQWAARQATRNAARAHHKRARDHGLPKRHARKLAHVRATQEGQ